MFAGMSANHDARQIDLASAEGRHLRAIWSRSGKRLIIDVFREVNSPEQIELTPEQVRELGEFLLESGSDS